MSRVSLMPRLFLAASLVLGSISQSALAASDAEALLPGEWILKAVANCTTKERLSVSETELLQLKFSKNSLEVQLKGEKPTVFQYRLKESPGEKSLHFLQFRPAGGGGAEQAIEAGWKTRLIDINQGVLFLTVSDGDRLLPIAIKNDLPEETWCLILERAGDEAQQVNESSPPQAAPNNQGPIVGAWKLVRMTRGDDVAADEAWCARSALTLEFGADGVAAIERDGRSSKVAYSFANGEPWGELLLHGRTVPARLTSGGKTLEVILGPFFGQSGDPETAQVSVFEHQEAR